MQSCKKRWPADVVMIIAAYAGSEDRSRMEAVVIGYCRDCHAALAVDSLTIRTAQQLPSRRGRPIRYLCPFCYTAYDLSTITEVHDHRHRLDAIED